MYSVCTEMIRVILFIITLQLVVSVKYNPERRLIRWLMLGYDRRSRPIYNSSKAIAVLYEFKLSEIQGVNERSNKIDLFAWQNMVCMK